jgi:hypothetical protein
MRSVPEPCIIALDAEQELRYGRLSLVVGQERHLRMHVFPEALCSIPILSLQQPLLDPRISVQPVGVTLQESLIREEEHECRRPSLSASRSLSVRRT